MTIRHLGRIIGFSFVASLVVTTQAEAQTQVSTVGDVLNQLTSSWAAFPSLASAVAYILGLLFAARGVFQFKEHVDGEKNNQVPISTPIKHFMAGGMLFSLPFMSTAVMTNLIGSGAPVISFHNDHQPPPDATGIGDLDNMVVQFISNVAGPATYMLIGFAYISAILLLITAITRMTKTAQEGARGPTGIGTLMTFIASGALFSVGQMIGVFTSSLFGTSTVSTYVNISQEALPSSDVQYVAPVIESLMTFIMIVGFIAFIRGWFVLKAFADGNTQGGASLAQGLTFLLGGALAINLGQFVDVLQATVGVSGITFS